MVEAQSDSNNDPNAAPSAAEISLAERMRSLKLGAYPAHGSGFVTIVADYAPGGHLVEDCRAAADRIDELEAALRQVVSWPGCARRKNQ
jgi:hypothetical protein